MKEHPILFSGAMVRAILAGEKTQTRRLIGLSSFKPSETPGYAWTFRGRAPVRSVAQQLRHPRGCWQDLHHDALLKLCPYGGPGDRLWVRETWAKVHGEDGPDGTPNVVFRAHDSSSRLTGVDRYGRPRLVCGWRPSIHMPRWASRLTLEVTEVRVERLQSITWLDARAEGIPEVTFVPDDGFPPSLGYAAGENDGKCPLHTRPIDAFRQLWDSINGERASWASNPWVWAISFRRVP